MSDRTLKPGEVDQIIGASGIKCETDFESLLKWTPPESLTKNFQYEICGKMANGCPVVIYRLGSWDFRKLDTKENREIAGKYFDQLYAKIDLQMKKNAKLVGKPVNQYFQIVDYANFSMKQIFSVAGINGIRQFVNIYEEKYNGAMKHCFMLNTSSLFQTLTAMVKPLMSANTVGVFEIFGTNQEEWKTGLLAKIPEDELSFTLGGKLVPFGTGTQGVPYERLIYLRKYNEFIIAVESQVVEQEE